MCPFWMMYVSILSAGLFLECPGTTAHSLRSTLQLIRAPIQSLSVYDFDRSVTSLSSELFAGEIHIRHLQFSHSHLQFLADNSLRNLHSSLESLSIVNGKLTQVWQENFSYNFPRSIYHEWKWHILIEGVWDNKSIVMLVNEKIGYTISLLAVATLPKSWKYCRFRANNEFSTRCSILVDSDTECCWKRYHMRERVNCFNRFSFSMLNFFFNTLSFLFNISTRGCVYFLVHTPLFWQWVSL